MPALSRRLVWLLPVLLCACKQAPMHGRYHCQGEVRFSFERQTLSVELIHGGQRYQGVMDEKRQLSWPKNPEDRTLPDTYALSRKDPKVLTLYGGLAGTGLACRQDPG